MIPFEEVWDYVDRIPGSFTRINSEKLYEYAVGATGNVVEVGVDQGRSASVLAFAARQTKAKLFLVDSWVGLLSPNQKKVADRMAANFPDVSYSVYRLPSVEAATLFEGTKFSLVHIDADHWGNGPEEDCGAWLPKLISGGVACFHDFRVPTMGDVVDKAVDKYTAGWEDLGAWEGLGIRRKP